MEATLSLLGGGGGGGGGGGDQTASKVAQRSKEAELDLGLGLSLSSGSAKAKGSSWDEYRRILTAKDFSNGFSSTVTAGVGAVSVSGTKRAADSVASPEVGSITPATASQVVGWPPIRAYRMNSLVSQAKTQNSEEDKVGGSDDKGKDALKKKVYHGGNKNDIPMKEIRGHLGFVKVNMDGLPIGRKVDLNAHSCYEALAKTVQDMFFPSATVNSLSGEKEQVKKPSKLLDGSFDYVLTYEDKEGDWMLVGDIPWGMFLGTAKRLRIMRTSEANGLAAPRIQPKDERQRSKQI